MPSEGCKAIKGRIAGMEEAAIFLKISDPCVTLQHAISYYFKQIQACIEHGTQGGNLVCQQLCNLLLIKFNVLYASQRESITVDDINGLVYTFTAANSTDRVSVPQSIAVRTPHAFLQRGINKDDMSQSTEGQVALTALWGPSQPYNLG